MTTSEDLRVSLCFICQNGDRSETESLPKMLESAAKYFDEVVSTVTFKDEIGEIHPQTQAILDKYGCKISKFLWTDNFSDARNFNFDQATMPLAMWLDSDDELIGGEKLRDIIDKNFTGRPVNQLWFEYEYAHDEDGNVLVKHARERVVVRKLHRWKRRLHEQCMCKFKPLKVKVPDIVVKHTIDVKELDAKAERNLTIIQEAYLKEALAGDIDPCTIYDLARSFQGLSQFEEAIKHFYQFLEKTNSNEDRYDALMRLCDTHIVLGKIKEATENALSGLSMNPLWPDAYQKMAKLWFIEEDYEGCLQWLRSGESDEKGNKLEIPYTMARTDLQYTVYPMTLKWECYFRTNRPKEALKILDKILKIVPSDKEIKKNRDMVVKFLNFNRAFEGASITYDLLKEEGADDDKLKSFVNSLPDMVKQHRKFVDLRARFYPKKAENRLVIFCERSLRDWDPDSVKTGIGGSEEAVINIAKCLVKQGWTVDVYNQTPKAGVWDGVNYYPYDQYDFQPCEVFIAWRMAEYIACAPKDALKILWCHDIQEIENYSYQIVEKIDKIFMLSEYHRTNLPELPDDKFYVTRNGIDPEHFNERRECKPTSQDNGDGTVTITDKVRIGFINPNDPNKYIYASSPDRGLIYILRSWQKILDWNPKAQLFILYGYNEVFKYLERKNDARQDLKQEISDFRSKFKNSVHWVGMVGHQEVADWFMKCGFWLYPTDFPEISCITAMKAQAAGCWPVCTDFAALAETVKYGTITKGIIPDCLDEWVASVQRASTEATPQARAEMRKYAIENLSWMDLSKDWTCKFKLWYKDKTKQCEALQKEQVHA